MHVSEVMHSPAECCCPETNLDAVAKFMWDHDCGAIPVVDDSNKPIGIVTDRDIAMSSFLNHKPLWEISSKEITSKRPLFTCKSDDDIRNALETMEREKIRRLPVVNSNGELQEILSVDGIVFFAKQGTDLSYDDTAGTLKAVSIHH